MIQYNILYYYLRRAVEAVLRRPHPLGPPEPPQRREPPPGDLRILTAAGQIHADSFLTTTGQFKSSMGNRQPGVGNQGSVEP